MNKLLIFTFFLLYMPAVSSPKLGVTVGYPYLGIKYNFLENFALEFRSAVDYDIRVFVGRFYWNFKKFERLNVFMGFECGYIDFVSYDIKGDGYETSVFLGGEYFIFPKLSFNIDFSPTLIGVKSGRYEVSGVEFVLNLGLNFYFLSR